MSDTTVFSLTETKITEFISLEHGAEKLTLSIFGAKSTWGRKESSQIEIDPDEAIRLANDLIRRASLIKQHK